MEAQLAIERQAFQSRISTALANEDDPLEVYYQYVQWILKNYPAANLRESGLLGLLEEATRKFTDDLSYKTDLRYLKLWNLYAKQVEQSTAIRIYTSLFEKEIGTTYSVLYEKYAELLEQIGRTLDAEHIYLKGIERRVRPLERLRSRYREFQARCPSSSSSSGLTVTTDAEPHASSSNPPIPLVTPALHQTPTSSPYALMLAPPAPGKRPEKLRFNLSLLFTEDGVEYSIQEARARSIGLLGKKWSPPHPSELRQSSSLPTANKAPTHANFAPVDSNDAMHTKDSKNILSHRRKSGLTAILSGGPEPTVTINTKEALADVFGMYNSPEKTRLMGIPGSKHAPLKKVGLEPMTPGNTSRNPDSIPRETSQVPTTSIPAFRPFVDENSQGDDKLHANKKENSVAPKIKPYVDHEPVNIGHNVAPKTPLGTQAARLALAPKDVSTPAANARSLVTENENARNDGGIRITKLKSLETQEAQQSSTRPENVLGKVFTPVSRAPPFKLQEQPPSTGTVFKPGQRDTATDSFNIHTRAYSASDALSYAKLQSAFSPFIDEESQTPFKVFSRPPEKEQKTKLEPQVIERKAFTPRPAFTPFRDRDRGDENVWADRDMCQGGQDTRQEAPATQTEEESTSDSSFETPVQDQGEYEDEEPVYDHRQDLPLGGRFGQFNVMTPITERTFECTSTRSVFSATPSDRLDSEKDSVFSRQQGMFSEYDKRDEYEAVVSAKRLAAELEEEVVDRENLRDGHLQPLHQPRKPETEEQDGIALIEERTGKLSLFDTLTKTSAFKPPNPCNPHDPSIISTLLTLIPSDSYFYDLRHRDADLLDGLQKFVQRARKTSGSKIERTSMADTGMYFTITLDGAAFGISEKLGEGGFGAVFKARDLGHSHDTDDDSYSEDDDELKSLVAVKVVKPAGLWEYHVLRRMHSALSSRLQRSLVIPHALYAYRDSSFLLLELCNQGTLLSLVNNVVTAGVSQQGACLDELLVIFFTTELLRLVEGLHSAGFIHGDLKIDNVLVRLEDVPGGASAWSSNYQRSGEGGWAYKGVKVIDFGRTIDTRLWPSNQMFVAGWETDERDCAEARAGGMWTYEGDYFGLAGIIYCMLFGKYIQDSAIVPCSGTDGRRRIGTPFKRYWQTELWGRLFDILLNPRLCQQNGRLPLCDMLSEVRGQLEHWLEKNCNRSSNTLKGLLKKVERSVWENQMRRLG